jgi:hypothetical protein
MEGKPRNKTLQLFHHQPPFSRILLLENYLVTYLLLTFGYCTSFNIEKTNTLLLLHALPDTGYKRANHRR